jgi:hypothetical protein
MATLFSSPAGLLILGLAFFLLLRGLLPNRQPPLIMYVPVVQAPQRRNSGCLLVVLIILLVAVLMVLSRMSS